jgi:tRNA 5-methylaminomethyl-2-thiouridine biosynthesis bifunctional protein
VSSPFSPIEAAQLIWRDGLPYCALSNTLYCLGVEEVNKAGQVFIHGNNLALRWQNLKEQSAFIIAETEFKAGLNFLLSWSYWIQYAPKTARLHYISCENHPLNREDLTRVLSLWPQFERLSLLLLEDYPILTPGFHHFSFEQGRITLTLMLGDSFACFNELVVCGDAVLEKELRTHFVDVWYVNDLILVQKNEGLMKSVALLSKKGTTITSNTPIDTVKDELQKAGFNVHKNHATFEKSDRRQRRHTPWHINATPPVKTKRAIVLGAGLGGCFSAYSLAKRGWDVLLIDANSQVATGASGAPRAVLYPKLSAYSSPLTTFMLSAYLYANRFYSKLLKTHPVGELAGILQMAFNEKERASQNSMREWLSAYPSLGKLVNNGEATQLAGISLGTGGLYLPLSGWLDCQAICDFLSEQKGITLIPDFFVDELDYREGHWCLGGKYQSEVLIIANGFQANRFKETCHLPLKAMAGQLTIIPDNRETTRLKIPLCGEGHVLPTVKNQHILGATYHQCLHVGDKDDEKNLSKLATLTTAPVFTREVIGNWQGVRGATPDYLPLVGSVPDAASFLKTFAPLATDSRRWLPYSGNYYPGLYLCAGFGSRGLTTAPMCAEWLASTINHEPDFLPRNLVQALSPARFLIKKIVKSSRGE